MLHDVMFYIFRSEWQSIDMQNKNFEYFIVKIKLKVFVS